MCFTISFLFLLQEYYITVARDMSMKGNKKRNDRITSFLLYRLRLIGGRTPVLYRLRLIGGRTPSLIQ